jgi:hypothetical protein
MPLTPGYARYAGARHAEILAPVANRMQVVHLLLADLLRIAMSRLSGALSLPLVAPAQDGASPGPCERLLYFFAFGSMTVISLRRTGSFS